MEKGEWVINQQKRSCTKIGQRHKGCHKNVNNTSDKWTNP